ncbi:MAG TPA: MarR family winged helix-turn-helix transcriptional regulator [Candidatus Dormibacteraeota bacterium]|nr:MarR family winged helix-turn-helix transcriptional regulator [Candidatus Dormibacteraeota bacterium]
MSDEFVPGLRYRSRAQELWALVVECLAGWEERMNEVSSAVGLSPVSAWTLVQLDPDHAISQKELAARLRCNPSTVVDPTDRLEERGLVIRRPNAADRRVNILTVTPKGREVRDELVGRLFEPPAAFRRLSPADQGRLRDAMLVAVRDSRAPLPAAATGERSARRS